MTDYQNELVMEHLDLVNWVIRTRISVPNRPLLTYDDFYAIGCEAICRAALKYQADSGEFAPFACRYIYNAIIDHCRAMNYRLQRSVDAGFEEGEVLFDLLAHTTVDFEAEVTDDSAIGMALYKLNDCFNDKFSFYIYFQDELKTLDDWIRETDLSGSFYFGGTLDYHF